VLRKLKRKGSHAPQIAYWRNIIKESLKCTPLSRGSAVEDVIEGSGEESIQGGRGTCREMKVNH
jgi:hypothetical protein